MSEIFKIQRPIFTSGGRHDCPMLLIYIKSGSFRFQVPMSPDIMELFKESDEFKIYVMGDYQGQDTKGEHTLHVGMKVEEQDW